MKKTIILSFALWTLSASNVYAQTISEDRIELAASTAVLFGKDGRAMFHADRKFLIAFTGNQEGKVFEYDTDRRLVRISRWGFVALWLRCADLKPMKVACVAAETLQTSKPQERGFSIARRPPLQTVGMIPFCPGDPRCPKLK